jgi:hypothetical protein
MLAAAPDASFMDVRSARSEPGLLVLPQIVFRLRSRNAVFAGQCWHGFGTRCPVPFLRTLPRFACSSRVHAGRRSFAR